MLFDGIKLIEGTSIINLVVPSGTTFPDDPDPGELFFKTDSSLLYIWDGAAWVAAQNTIQYTPVNKTGDSMSGPLTLPGDPVLPLQAATKQYVDGVAQGIIVKPSVRAATTSNLTATYDNGASGVGASLVFSGPLPQIDGVTLSVGNGVLVKNQTNAAQNGRYVVTQLNPGVLQRCGLCDEASEIPGAHMFVQDGSQKGTGWVLTVANPAAFIVGTDAITVTQISSQDTRYEMAVTIQGKPEADSTVMYFVATRSFVIEANAPLSFARAKTASTGTATFTMYKNASSIGTLTFSSGTNGTFSTSLTSFNAGDVLSIVAPNPQDSMLADIGITIVGTLT